MKIAMINGSPKLKESNSSALLKILESSLPKGHEITYYSLNKKPLTEEQYKTLCHTDVLVFAFPLYIDAIPSHLFRMLVELEAYIKTEPKTSISVYGMVNNGFFEGQQNHIALEILENWCIRCGLSYGQGIGQGAGEMLAFVQNVPLGHGPVKNLGNAINSLVGHIVAKSKGTNLFSVVNYPHFAWQFSAHSFWNSSAKKNGLKKRDILKKLS